MTRTRWKQDMRWEGVPLGPVWRNPTLGAQGVLSTRPLVHEAPRKELTGVSNPGWGAAPRPRQVSAQVPPGESQFRPRPRPLPPPQSSWRPQDGACLYALAHRSSCCRRPRQEGAERAAAAAAVAAAPPLPPPRPRSRSQPGPWLRAWPGATRIASPAVCPRRHQGSRRRHCGSCRRRRCPRFPSSGPVPAVGAPGTSACEAPPRREPAGERRSWHGDLRASCAVGRESQAGRGQELTERGAGEGPTRRWWPMRGQGLYGIGATRAGGWMRCRGRREDRRG